MATVHVGANADPHPNVILVPPEGWLVRKDSNLQSPDPESGALPFGHSPPGPDGLQEFIPRRRAPQRSRACTLAHVSLSVSVRLKTRWSGVESESGVK